MFISYGLKLLPLAWYHELTSVSLTSTFKNSYADTSLFVLNTGTHLLYLLVFVDDIVLTSDNFDLVHQFVDCLTQRFSLKDLSPLSYFLGVEIVPHRHGILLSQRRYIVDILIRTHMLGAKPVSTPLPHNLSLSLYSSAPLSDPTEYHTIVGSLQYLSLTHSDISYVVSKLSRFMHHPSTEHWVLVKRLLRYLCGTLDDGVLLYRNSPLSLRAFSDTD